MKIDSLNALATLFVMIMTLPHDKAFAETGFRSGVYENLMVSVDKGGNILGYYREEQGDEVKKTCSFFLNGKLQPKEISIISWNIDYIDGKIVPLENSITLKIDGARDHPGCGLVLSPKIDSGMVLDRTYVAPWLSLGKITSPRAKLFRSPDRSSGLSSYLVRGNVVGIRGREQEWTHIEYVHGRRPLTGWMLNSDLDLVKPSTN